MCKTFVFCTNTDKSSSVANSENFQRKKNLKKIIFFKSLISSKARMTTKIFLNKGMNTEKLLNKKAEILYCESFRKKTLVKI
jgi:hypothetical protein